MSLNASACNHTSPDDLSKMAEDLLKKNNLPEASWDGCVFGFGENVVSPVYLSVYIEIVRRGENWFSTKIDRRKVAIVPEDNGFVIRELSKAAQEKISL